MNSIIMFLAVMGMINTGTSQMVYIGYPTMTATMIIRPDLPSPSHLSNSGYSTMISTMTMRPDLPSATNIIKKSSISSTETKRPYTPSISRSFISTPPRPTKIQSF